MLVAKEGDEKDRKRKNTRWVGKNLSKYTAGSELWQKKIESASRAGGDWTEK